MGNKLKTVDAETLLSTPMSKTMFIVDGLISQGVNVISGASKIGKSWLMLWLGLQVAQGNSIWGLPTLQCDVLYLSLEDTQRRIKDRLYNLTDSAPDNLYFAVTSGLIGGGLEEQITDFLTEHSATKLVIIDTLQKVRDSKGSAGKAGMYGNDYDDISSIKRIADGFNIAILLVHHLRKLQDSDDPFNDVSGSTGIIGAADTNFILRRKRSGNAATLLVSGRDVEYQELTLQFNDLVWELVERKNSEDIHKAELPKFLFRVVDFMECRTEWVGTATELLTEMKEQEVTPNMVTKYLGQFAYEVLEPLGIEYRTKRTGKSRLIKFLRRDGDEQVALVNVCLALDGYRRAVAAKGHDVKRVGQKLYLFLFYIDHGYIVVLIGQLLGKRIAYLACADYYDLHFSDPLNMSILKNPVTYILTYYLHRSNTAAHPVNGIIGKLACRRAVAAGFGYCEADNTL